MPYVQPFCLNGNVKSVQFGSKVEFTKMRTKTCYVCFFKESDNKRAFRAGSQFYVEILPALRKGSG